MLSALLSTPLNRCELGGEVVGGIVSSIAPVGDASIAFATPADSPEYDACASSGGSCPSHTGCPACFKAC